MTLPIYEEGSPDPNPPFDQYASRFIPDPGHRTEDDGLQLGNEDELNGNVLVVLQTYQDALARFPESVQGRKAAGRLSSG